MQKKVKINIAGMECKISSDRDPEYVMSLAKEINQKIDWYMNKNNTLSINHVFILLLLEYLDNYRDAKKSEDNLRDQLNKYIQEFTESRKEITDLKQKLKNISKNNKNKPEKI